LGGEDNVPRYGTPGFDHGQLRASDADRDRTVDVFKAAFAEGRLTKDEYDERLENLYASRTYAELAALTADLPIGPHSAPLPASTGAYVPVPVHRPTNSLAVASLILGLVQPFTMFLTTIPAVVCGHVARRQIRRTGESGRGLATAGLTVGWIGVVFLTLMIIGIVAVSVTSSGPAPQP